MERRRLTIDITRIPVDQLNLIWDRVILHMAKNHSIAISEKFRFEFDFSKYDKEGQEIIMELIASIIATNALTEVSLNNQKKE